MIAAAFLALGLVMVVEGLVYALAPSLVERLLVMLQILPESQRRRLGLSAMSFGIALVWIAKTLGA